MHEVCSNLTPQPQERDYLNPVWYPPTLLTTTTTISTTSSYITATENHDPISPEPQLSLPTQQSPPFLHDDHVVVVTTTTYQHLH